jgi:hypothetical protein
MLKHLLKFAVAQGKGRNNAIAQVTEQLADPCAGHVTHIRDIKIQPPSSAQTDDMAHKAPTSAMPFIFMMLMMFASRVD